MKKSTKFMNPKNTYLGGSLPRARRISIIRRIETYLCTISGLVISTPVPIIGARSNVPLGQGATIRGSCSPYKIGRAHV